MTDFSRRAIVFGGMSIAALPAIAAVGHEPLPVAGMAPGSIVVFTRRRRLYLAQHDGTAISYPVAVGRLGKQWVGTRTVSGKYVRPAWIPPEEIRRDNPRLPAMIPGGVPHNPMGERVLTMFPGEYAIHGTNQPSSIGRYASYGCVRMHNADIIDLYERVAVGASVTMMP